MITNPSLHAHVHEYIFLFKVIYLNMLKSDIERTNWLSLCLSVVVGFPKSF